MNHVASVTRLIFAFLLLPATLAAQVRPAPAPSVSPADADRRLPITMAPGGLRQLTAEENDERDPVFSPRGDVFAVSSNRSGTFELWLYPSRQGGIRQLTSNPTDAQDIAPDWHPNANALLFQSNRIGGIPNIWRYNFSERGITQLTLSKFGAEGARYSPDGNQIVFTMYDATARRSIWMMDAEGRNPTLLTDGFDPSWSPDGRTIVFARTVREGSDRTTDIWLMDVDGTNPRRLTTEKSKSETAPRFSPDGQTILFEMTWNPTDSVSATPTRRILREIWMIGVDGQNARQLTLYQGSRPSWSPDGRMAIFSSARGSSQDVWMIQPTVPNTVSRP